MEQQIKFLKIEDHIIYTGPLYATDKLSAYVDSNIYVLPSIYETFPMTVLEAFACGKPVIVTDRCGISDIVEKVGIVVKYDEKELSEAIIELLNNEELANKIGREGKELVAARFDLESVIEKTINIYTDVIVE